MTEQQYREQFENQVKDLITQYLETHGEAPAITIEWGKVKAAEMEPEVVNPPFSHNCVDPLFDIKGCDMPKGSCSSCTVKVVPPEDDTKKKKRLDDAWGDLGNTLSDMGSDEPGW